MKAWITVGAMGLLSFALVAYPGPVAVTDGQPTVTVTTVPAAPDCPYGDQPGTPIRRPHVAGIKPGHYPPDIACWPIPGGA